MSPLESSLPRSSEICFLCDAMLGRLARYLRMMGYNTLYTEEEDSAILSKLESTPNCVLLTRDKLLCERARWRCFYITSDKIKDQLIQLSLETGIILKLPKVPTRCTLCNGPLEYVGWTRDRELWVCKSCGQPYWKGSHTRRVEAFLKSLREMLSVP